MKKLVGVIKIHYRDCQGKAAKDIITTHVYDLKEFEKAVSLYNFLMENEIECELNENTDHITADWGATYELTVDNIMVTLGNDVDLWVLDVYVK